MTWNSDDLIERKLAAAELELESERKRVEAILKECGETKVQPAKDYWHRLEFLRRKVNLLRALTEPKK